MSRRSTWSGGTYGALWSPSHRVGEKCWCWWVKSGGGIVNRDLSNLAGELGESLMCPKRKHFLHCSGGGRRPDPKYTSREMCFAPSVLDWPRHHLGDVLFKMVALLHPLGAQGTMRTHIHRGASASLSLRLGSLIAERHFILRDQAARTQGAVFLHCASMTNH